MQVFKTNEFFAGVTLPTPHTLEPLEEKLPRQQNAHVLDFLKVLNFLSLLKSNNFKQKFDNRMIFSFFFRDV